MMPTTVSRTDGNLLRRNTDGRGELRAAAHLLASLLARDHDAGPFVLDYDRDEDSGDLTELGVYEFDTFEELQGEDDLFEDAEED